MREVAKLKAGDDFTKLKGEKSDDDEEEDAKPAKADKPGKGKAKGHSK